MDVKLTPSQKTWLERLSMHPTRGFRPGKGFRAHVLGKMFEAMEKLELVTKSHHDEWFITNQGLSYLKKQEQAHAN